MLTEKQKDAFFETGHVPYNKRILSSEEETYLRENYATTPKVDMAKKLKLNPNTILRIMNRMNLKRTPDEIALIRANKRKRGNDWKLKVQKIEGGGRENKLASYHLFKWIKQNGKFTNKKILVYKNSEYDNYNDIVLIFKRHYEDFFIIRENRKARAEKKHVDELEKSKKRDDRLLEKKKIEAERAVETAKRKEAHDKIEAERAIKREEKRKIKEKKDAEILQKALAKAAVRGVTLKKRLDEEEREKRFEAIKASRPKSLSESNQQLLQEDKVPVELDHRTTVWVKKSKCDFVNGKWIKKTPLNIVIQEELNLKPKKHERKEGLLDKAE